MSDAAVQEPPVSALRSFLDEIVDDNREFKHTDLEEFRQLTLSFLDKSKGAIREQDRRKMILTVHQEQTLMKLQFYIYNSLLKFEGLGVVELLPR